MEPLSVEQLISLYRTMARIRETEERLADLVTAGEVKTPCHLYIGQEAIAAGVCATLTDDDYVWGGHRSHGHYLAKGGNLRGMVAEIFGRVTGCSEGRGGSMHLVAPQVGILGTVPLVAATIPLAVGAGMAAKLRGERRVSVAFFGDGAVEEGHFHESLNLAALYKAPVIFVCENNLYASHMGLLERRVDDNIHTAAAVHGAAGQLVDGNDVLAVHAAATAAVARARRGEGPTLLECRTYRWRGHVGPSWDMDVGVQRKDELHEWLPRDPLARLASSLQEAGVQASVLESLRQEIGLEVAEAIEFARTSPYPDAAEMARHVYVQAGER